MVLSLGVLMRTAFHFCLCKWLLVGKQKEWTATFINMPPFVMFQVKMSVVLQLSSQHYHITCYCRKDYFKKCLFVLDMSCSPNQDFF